MSTKYIHTKDIPSVILIKRLEELATAVTKGEKGEHEFYMRIPAECDNDADLVLSEAAQRIKRLEKELVEGKREATSLANALYARYKGHAYKIGARYEPEFIVLGTLPGILTQIDHLSAGLSEVNEDDQVIKRSFFIELTEQ